MKLPAKFLTAALLLIAAVSTASAHTYWSYGGYGPWSYGNYGPRARGYYGTPYGGPQYGSGGGDQYGYGPGYSYARQAPNLPPVLRRRSSPIRSSVTCDVVETCSRASVSALSYFP